MEEINKKIIGRLEYVDLPEFGLSGIIGKVDTGAYSGAIHTTHIIEKEVDGKTVIEFKLLDESHPQYNDTIYQSDVFEKKLVKSSNGVSKFRYFIPLSIVIAGNKIHTTISLSNREKMNYPLLIGRRTIKDLFLVDVSREFVYSVKK